MMIVNDSCDYEVYDHDNAPTLTTFLSLLSVLGSNCQRETRNSKNFPYLTRLKGLSKS
jgi:hypothetical protein